MPIVVYHDSGQLVGDLASNVGAFKTQEVYHQQALQQQELAMRQQAMQQSQDRYNEQNAIRQQQVDQQGQLGQGRLDNALSIEQQREAARQGQIAQQTDAMGRVHQADNAARGARQKQRLDYQGDWETDRNDLGYYRADQQNQLGQDRLGFNAEQAKEQQYQFDAKMEAQKQRWAQQQTKDPTQALALRQETERRIAGDSRHRAEDSGRKFEISQLDRESREIDGQLKAMPNPYGDEAKALRERQQVVTGVLRQRVAEFHNFYAGVMSGDQTGWGAGSGIDDEYAQPQHATPAIVAPPPPTVPAANPPAQQPAGTPQPPAATQIAAAKARSVVLHQQALQMGIADPAARKLFIQHGLITQGFDPGMVARL